MVDTHVVTMLERFFLLFYTFWAAFIFYATSRYRRRLYKKEDASFTFSSNENIYALAYLCGGKRRVFELALFKLFHLGLLHKTHPNEGFLRANGEALPDIQAHLEPVEIDLLHHFRQAAPMICVPDVVDQHLPPFNDALVERGFLLSKGGWKKARRTSVLGLAALIGMGGFKFLLIPLFGPRNILPLCIFMLIFAMGYWYLYRPGKNYLASTRSRVTPSGEKTIRGLRSSCFMNDTLRKKIKDSSMLDKASVKAVAIAGVTLLPQNTYPFQIRPLDPFFLYTGSGI